MKNKYNPSEIEKKWQKIWEEKKVYKPNLEKSEKPFYNLMMFPYPSAEGLHAGNMYAFVGADIFGRYMRMKGNDVFEPIGLDGFGIHSENYALKIGKNPMDQAKISQENFYKQLHLIGNGYDWDRTVETYDPNYYKWTQWLFTKMFEKGLAVKKKSPVNFCPSCKTVLADEQVINEKCERCDSVVEKKNLEQWFFKITDYAERLLSNIPKLNWSEKVKIAQTNWIGRSEGMIVKFPLETNINYVLLHGFTGSPKDNFFPWLKEELIKNKSKVFVPNLPDTNNPDILKQVKFVEDNCEFNKNTVLLGHSLGSVVALKVIENLKNPIKKLVIVAGFAEPGFLDKERPFEKKFDWKFDFEKIKKNVKEIVYLRAKNDTAVPSERVDFLKKNLNGKIIDFTAEDDHICGQKEPIVLENLLNNIEVFTTRPDTLYGATFLVLSPEHEFVKSLSSKEVKDYVQKASKKSDIERQAEGKEKTGVFTDLYAINPVNNEKIPVFIADYVLSSYGTGAIMAVPAHDQRDFDFAKKYNVGIKQVIEGKTIEGKAYTGDGKIINSEDLNGLYYPKDKEKIIDMLSEKRVGKKEVHFHLRDWLISRQRYWGPPIPIIYCPDCGAVPVPEKDLPVKLPYIENYKPIGTGKSPLASHPEFYNTKCPKCNKDATRETDVSDTFLDSAWYFFRYTSTEEKNKIFNKEVVKKWLPVDIYIGGAEHSVLHLLYSRFMTMFLKDLGLINFEEPYKRFFAHGLLIKEGAKMSKSKGNVITPDKYIEKFGADTMRCYLMFLGQFREGGDFYDTGVEGMNRFLKRIWVFSNEVSLVEKESDKEVLRMIHKTVKEVSRDIERLSYNTSLAKLMEFYNFIVGKKSIGKDVLEAFLKLLAPFAPHMTEELYQLKINTASKFCSIHNDLWPSFEEKYLVQEQVLIVVQVNGKVRETLKLKLAESNDQAKVEAAAKKSKKIKSYIDGKKIKKIIYIKGKILNFVIG